MRQGGLAPLLARIFGSAIFILSGWAKVMAGAGLAGSMAKHGLPFPMLAAIVADVVELGGGVLLLVGLFTRPVAGVLAIWCVATALVAHTDWSHAANKVNFLKNMAMTGGYIAIATLGAGELSLDAMLRRRRIVVRA